MDNDDHEKIVIAVPVPAVVRIKDGKYVSYEHHSDREKPLTRDKEIAQLKARVSSLEELTGKNT